MEPPDSKQTIRQAIIELLGSEKLTIRELSQTLRLSEKDIIGHLDHIELSMLRHGKKLLTTPYRCLTCGFVFDRRTRHTKPGRCPKCRNTHIQVAQFFIR